uniref:ATP synthase subunit a n=1 Tax=Sphaeriusidae sp. BMNH 703456 TaxID=1903818 RepID=A0A343A3G3_9COLE|nr:ATP synthase F0 subunit 6 [Sphaeriusidae sp. BMNH 703456]
MTNLFQSFDPTTNFFNFSLNWMSTFLGIILIPMIYWFMPSRFNILWIKLILILHKEFKILLNNKIQGSTLIFISLFSMILFINFMGLFPYIFTSSSHLTMTLSLSLPFWISFMVYGWIKNTQHMFSHLIPQGTPPVLMPFMVCIETISNLIRPMTLAVRLTANMIAGHLLMTLLGNANTMFSWYMIWILITIQILLLMLELAVSVIQSYVFSILSTLYSSEIN